jgi:hypothetical protein
MNRPRRRQQHLARAFGGKQFVRITQVALRNLEPEPDEKANDNENGRDE